MDDLQQALGFTWDRQCLPILMQGDKAAALFRVKKLLPEFVWDTTVLEDNPFSFPEVKTLLDGITVGGHKLSDEQQVLNQAESWRYLLELIKTEQFLWSKKLYGELNNIVARDESLEWGVFRTGKVSIAGTQYIPPAATQLDEIFQAGLSFLITIPNVFERSLLFFLFGALQQFFYDGNKRAARLMMNGELLRHGIDAISIPGSRKQEFNEKMLRFYETKNGTEMLQFLLTCWPTP